MRARAISSQLLALLTLLAILVAPLCAPLCAARQCGPATGGHCSQMSGVGSSQPFFAGAKACVRADLAAVVFKSEEHFSNVVSTHNTATDIGKTPALVALIAAAEQRRLAARGFLDDVASPRAPAVLRI